MQLYQIPLFWLAAPIFYFLLPALGATRCVIKQRIKLMAQCMAFLWSASTLHCPSLFPLVLKTNTRPRTTIKETKATMAKNREHKRARLGLWQHLCWLPPRTPYLHSYSLHTQLHKQIAGCVTEMYVHQLNPPFLSFVARRNPIWNSFPGRPLISPVPCCSQRAPSSYHSSAKPGFHAQQLVHLPSSEVLRDNSIRLCDPSTQPKAVTCQAVTKCL